MEDKKVFYIIAIVIILALIVTGVILLFFYFQKTSTTPDPNAVANVNQNQTAGTLPNNQTVGDPNDPNNAAAASLAKEKQFISSFWRPSEISFNPSLPTYQTPITEIKNQIVNYRDFSRKIDVESSLEKLAANSFVVIADPFKSQSSDWETSYKLIRENELPIFISTDSVAGVYQTTLHVIYKEIEQDIFYPSLWKLLNQLYQKNKARYDQKLKQFGIQTDLLTEANRLELSYLAVALKLLQPDVAQIREPLSTDDNKFFTPQEAGQYAFNIPDYLDKEVTGEIELITKKIKGAESKVFLYPKNYQVFDVPEQYRTSEKLKNYYLAITWLNEGFFPLWHQDNDCADCLLDEQDHQINLVAALLLSTDLASDQNLKNSWANIYKSISFFRGLESNLTYIDYAQSLKNIFGDDYDIEQLFSADNATVKERISLIQEALGSVTFLSALGGDNQSKPNTGLRLLRNYHLLENKLFNRLTYQATGEYLGETKNVVLPFTGCNVEKLFLRCWPTSLDLFNLLGNQTAANILSENKNNLYQNYQPNLNQLKEELTKFDQNTWHDNAYLSLLSALQKINHDNTAGYPVFMTTDAWRKKTLTTSLGAWVDFHKEINFERSETKESGGLGSYFPYGYVEPQVAFYGELLSNVKMIIEGFNTLQIISPVSRSYERLNNLKITLEKLADISKKELENTSLEQTDYEFINNFNKHIRTFIGDVRKESIQNTHTLRFPLENNRLLDQKNKGLDYLIVAYPNSTGQLFFAIGPVYSFTEEKNGGAASTNWQTDYKIK
ncbi:MAG: DUF3160 domain-containing protein [Candidatus Buchananbacteria bacterium]|nr:DUF3160 domain-containing protein [Candidatus Buchananbacteria bacterium]